MKKIIIIAALFLSMSIYAQEPQKKIEYNKETKTFSASKTSNKDVKTAYHWVDNKGNSYPIWLHTYTRGENIGKTTCYVIRISQKTGKEYKYYLPNGIEIAEQILKENL